MLEPEEGVAAIGSGGNYALAAARAFMSLQAEGQQLELEDIATRAMHIAADICVMTNHHITIEKID